MNEVKDGGGHGLFYREPVWISSNKKDLWGSGPPWENSTLFDSDGNAHEGFGYLNIE